MDFYKCYIYIVDMVVDSKYSLGNIHDINESFFDNWCIGCINMIDEVNFMVGTMYVK